MRRNTRALVILLWSDATLCKFRSLKCYAVIGYSMYSSQYKGNVEVGELEKKRGRKQKNIEECKCFKAWTMLTTWREDKKKGCHGSNGDEIGMLKLNNHQIATMFHDQHSKKNVFFFFRDLKVDGQRLISTTCSPNNLLCTIP